MQLKGTPPTFIGKGCIIKGAITRVTNIRIEGVLEGDILDAESLVIGESGVVIGNVNVKAIINYGCINGDVLAAESVSIRNPGRHTGKINTRLLSIERGAACSGKIIISHTAINSE